MPHVVLSGKIEFLRLQKVLSHLVLKDQGRGIIIRIENSFLNASQDTLLVHAIAVEKISRSFYILASQKESGMTIRLDPLTDPEKTSGVKTAIAVVAVGAMICSGSEQPKVLKTNISEFLEPARELLGTRIAVGTIAGNG